MHLKRMLHTTGVVVVTLLSSVTVAHADSELTGTVLAVETKKPLPDVVVTATSPALQGERVVVTGALGRFHLSTLPPGVYTLRFHKESFKPFSQEGIELPPDRLFHVDVGLSREFQESEIPLCGEPGLDALSTTVTSQYVERSFTQRIAAPRSFGSLAGVVPGTQREADGYSIQGASPWENGYMVDGISTQDTVSGVNASPLSVEFLEDFEVITGGYMPRYGRATGGILRARTRSGSNTFHGSVFGYWAPGVLEGLRTPVTSRSSVITSQNTLQHLGEMGATLGGPIVKDKLWFFAGVAPEFLRVQHTRTVTYTDGTGTPVSSSSRSYFLDDRGLQAMGKLTYLFNQDHNVSLSFNTTPTQGIFGPAQADLEAGASGSVSDRNFTTAGLQYAGVFLDKRLQVEAHLGWTHQTARTLVGVSSGYPGEGGLDLALRPGKDRYQGNVQATWLLSLAGTHVFRAGVDTEHVASEKVLPPPTLPSEEPASRPSYRYTSNLLGGFVQDSWSLSNRVTVNAGLRYDTQWLYQADGPLAFALSPQLSPRVGVVVDPMAQGRMKLFAHYAKYHGQLPLGLMWGAFMLEGIYPRRSAATQPREVISGADPTLVATSTTELVAGAEYEVLPLLRLSAHYTHRQLDSVIEGMSLGYGYFLGNPGLGLAKDFPKAERTHDAVSLVLSRTFREGWLVQASYTLSRLYGNYPGPSNGDDHTVLSDFDLQSLMENQTGLLPYDRTHSLKLFGAREFQFTRELSASLGLSYLGRSGTPINYLGGHPLYGANETFILPRGSSGARTPWVHVIDSNVGINYRLGGDKVLSLTLDVFNLFNFQEVTRVDEIYTYAAVLPVKTGGPGDLPGAVLNVDTGEALAADEVNPNFKQPVQYQSPRLVRLGLRYAF
jgi:hypothetical protein